MLNLSAGCALMPEIVLIANYRPDKQKSMLKSCEMFAQILEISGFKVTTIEPIDRIGKLRTLFPWLAKWLGYVDKYLIFTLELFLYSRARRNSLLVYHIVDHSNAPYSFVLGGIPSVVTCNDVLAIRSSLDEIPENPTKSITGRFLQTAILAGLRRSHRIVSISTNTENELRRLIGSKTPLISTALLPLNSNFYPLARGQALEVLSCLGSSIIDACRSGFVLHVGGNQWYKNRMGVCAIYRDLVAIRGREKFAEMPLILAGQAPSVELLSFVANNKGLLIIFLEDPSDLELQALYSTASLFLFPSWQEGFGWPILEAMACGCPVAASGRAPMTEVGGDAAIYINPSETLASAMVLADMLNWNDEKRAFWIQRGFANLRKFSRENLAEHYSRAYTEAIRRAKQC
jgi:glycosyltransferase involved in cell wall biosynthesis